MISRQMPVRTDPSGLGLLSRKTWKSKERGAAAGERKPGIFMKGGIRIRNRLLGGISRTLRQRSSGASTVTVGLNDTLSETSSTTNNKATWVLLSSLHLRRRFDDFAIMRVSKKYVCEYSPIVIHLPLLHHWKRYS